MRLVKPKSNQRREEVDKLHLQLLELDAEKEANREEQRRVIRRLRDKSDVDLKPYEVEFDEIEMKKKIGVVKTVPLIVIIAMLDMKVTIWVG